MGAIPNISASSSAKSEASQAGSNWGGFGGGDWNVNIAGSGTALQTATSMSPWLYAAGAAVAVFFLMKK